MNRQSQTANRLLRVHTVLGANGAIGKGLVPLLLANGDAVRVVSRSPALSGDLESVAADLTEPEATRKAIAGSSVVYLLVGLKYDIRVWQDQWPKIMSNVIAACKESGSRLIFFDDVYMYGPVEGKMTEETAFRPTSAKGRLRADIANQLLAEMKSGSLEALIARCADFYGPGADQTSVANTFVFSKLAQGKRAQWLYNPNVPHSFTYIPDAARAVYLLGRRDDAFGQTWHMPTSPNPLTGREFVATAAAAMGAANALTVMPKWIVPIGGLFNSMAREAVEMTYENSQAYIFDSSKFNAAFELEPTSYQEGIRLTAENFKSMH